MFVHSEVKYNRGTIVLGFDPVIVSRPDPGYFGDPLTVLTMKMMDPHPSLSWGRLLLECYFIRLFCFEWVCVRVILF